MLDDIDMSEEIDRVPRYSQFVIDDEVFYTPGDENPNQKKSEEILESMQNLSEFDQKAAKII